MAAVAGGEMRLEAVVRGNYPGRPMPVGVLPQVSTIGFWDAARNQAWGLGLHRNEGIETSHAETLPASRLTLLVNEVLVCLLELLRAQKPHRKTSLMLGERSVSMFLKRMNDELHEPWTLEWMA